MQNIVAEMARLSEVNAQRLTVAYNISESYQLRLCYVPSLTRAYGNNGRRPRQKFVFGIIITALSYFTNSRLPVDTYHRGDCVTMRLIKHSYYHWRRLIKNIGLALGKPKYWGGKSW